MQNEEKSVILLQEGFGWIDLYSDGRLYSHKSQKFLKPIKNKNGVNIGLWKNGKAHNFDVARLVRKYFINEIRSYAPCDVQSLAFLDFPWYRVTRDGRIWNDNTYSFLKGSLSNKGYLQTILSSRQTKQARNVKIHRVVAEAFIPNPDNLPEVNHINGDKTDNRAENLEWVTTNENLRHARATGLKPMCLTDDDIHAACKLLEKDFTMASIARHLNVSYDAITHLRRGAHRHITKLYDIDQMRNSNSYPAYK